MAEPTSVPVLYDKGEYVADLIKSPAKGRFAGTLVFYPDEEVYEAWRYLTKSPVLIGRANSAPEALAFFYQRVSVPRPYVGWCSQIVKLGKTELMQSVQCCGSLRKCDCYGDGLVDGRPHKFRFESFEIVIRKIKRL